MKKLLALLMALVMVLSLAACGGNDKPAADAPAADAPAADAPATDTPAADAPADDVLIYMVAPITGGDAFGDLQIGFEQACSELGWEGYYVSPAVDYDTAGMCDLIQSAIDQGADIILGPWFVADVFDEVLKNAKDAGIIVGDINVQYGEEFEDFWIGTEPVAFGLAQANAAKELLPADGEYTVVGLQTDLTVVNQNTQYQSFCDNIADKTNVTIFDSFAMGSDAAAAQDILGSVIPANPQINVVTCYDDFATLGAAQYCKETGTAEDIWVFGIGDGVDHLKAIIDGKIDCTIAQAWYNMGYEGVQLAKTVLEGGEVSYDNDAGTVVITADNVYEYAKERGRDIG